MYIGPISDFKHLDRNHSQSCSRHCHQYRDECDEVRSQHKHGRRGPAHQVLLPCPVLVDRHGRNPSWRGWEFDSVRICSCLHRHPNGSGGGVDECHHHNVCFGRSVLYHDCLRSHPGGRWDCIGGLLCPREHNRRPLQHILGRRCMDAAISDLLCAFYSPSLPVPLPGQELRGEERVGLHRNLCHHRNSDDHLIQDLLHPALPGLRDRQLERLEVPGSLHRHGGDGGDRGDEHGICEQGHDVLRKLHSCAYLLCLLHRRLRRLCCVRLQGVQLHDKSSLHHPLPTRDSHDRLGGLPSQCEGRRRRGRGAGEGSH
mmetsp:Transcript_42975/g.135744  ORF Transcript_42975/g.135744 Transcript_42975/m.135744 type:complete len:314 (+) Transcript_42975:516-1457(+)